MQRQAGLPRRVERLPCGGRDIAGRQRHHGNRILRVEERVVGDRHVVRRNHPQNIAFAEAVRPRRIDRVFQVVEDDDRAAVGIQRDAPANHAAHADASVHLDHAARVRVDAAVEREEVTPVGAWEGGRTGGGEARIDGPGIRGPTAEVSDRGECRILSTPLIGRRRVPRHLVALDGDEVRVAPGVAHRCLGAGEVVGAIHDRARELVHVRRRVRDGHPGTAGRLRRAHEGLEPDLVMHGCREEFVAPEGQQKRSVHGVPIAAIVHERGRCGVPPRGVVRATHAGAHPHPRGRRVAAHIRGKVGAGREPRGLVVRASADVERGAHAPAVCVDGRDGLGVVHPEEAVLRLRHSTVIVEVDRKELEARIDHEARVRRRVDA